MVCLLANTVTHGRSQNTSLGRPTRGNFLVAERSRLAQRELPAVAHPSRLFCGGMGTAKLGLASPRDFRRVGPHTYFRTAAGMRNPASPASLAALSVASQVKSASLRPKWP